jgi:diacylglycerol kinase family enzyme
MLHFWHKNTRLETITTKELVVKGGRWRSVAVCNDGEIRKLRYPLRYRIRPGALKVLAPPDAPDP